MRLAPICFAILLAALTPGATRAEEALTGPAWLTVHLQYAAPRTSFGQAPEVIRTEHESLGINAEVWWVQERASLSFRYDYEYESIVDLLFRASDLDTGNFSRDRWEATVGYLAAERISIHGGFRNERFVLPPVDSPALPPTIDEEYLALVAGITGVTAHDRPVALYGTIRGYLGGTAIRRPTDTRGYLAEGGIRVTYGAVSFSPVYAYEWMDVGGMTVRSRRWSFRIGFAGFDAR